MRAARATARRRVGLSVAHSGPPWRWLDPHSLPRHRSPVYETFRVAQSERWRGLAAALLGPAEFTSGEVARSAGVELGDARRLWQALGFPPVPDDDRVFTRADVEVLRIARALIEQQDADPAILVQLARVTGQSLARVSDAQVTASAEQLERARTAGAPADLAFTALAERIAVLAPSLEQMLGYVWRRHLLAAL